MEAIIDGVTQFSSPRIGRESFPEIKICGVYFLFVGRKLIYIGASKDIRKRLGTHGSSDFTHYRYILVKEDVLMKVERRLLIHHRPPRNSSWLWRGWPKNLFKKKYMPKHQKKLFLDKRNPDQKAGFFTNLPLATIAKIRARTTKTHPQWKVIDDAIKATEPKPAKKKSLKKK